MSHDTEIFSNDPFDRFVQRAKWKPAKMVGAGQLTFRNLMAAASYASESDLLAACRRRDLRAFEQLYQDMGCG